MATRVTRIAHVGGFVRGDGGVGTGARGQRASAMVVGADGGRGRRSSEARGGALPGAGDGGAWAPESTAPEVS